MDPLSIVAGLADTVGDVATSAFNVHEMRQNRRSQIELSNTAHQREVDDLRKAGLNPILSANHGASTPPGGAAQISAPNTASAFDKATQVGALAYQAAQIRDTNSAAALKEMQFAENAQTQQDRLILVRTQLAQAGATLDLTKEQKVNLSKQLEEIDARIKQLSASAKLASTQEVNTGLDYHRLKAESDFYKDNQKVMPYLEHGMDMARPLLNLVPFLFPRGKR